jgi:hypothetical protein
MPPIQQQQTSRAGLITGLVVSIVFALAFLIWAFMSNAELNKAQQALDSQKTKYDKVIGPGALGDVATLQAQFSGDPDKPRTGTLMDAAAEQRSTLIKMIDGDAGGSEKKAADDVAATIAAIKANPALKDAVIPENAGLTTVVKVMTAKAISDAAMLKKATDERDAANQSLQATLASNQAEIAKRDQAVQEAQAAMTKAVADAKAAIDEKQKQVDDFSAKVAASEKSQGDLTAAQQVATQTLQRDLEKAKKDYDAAMLKLAQYKANTKESIVRNVDATITQVSPDNICYINLGFGDHISTGLTFEIYSKNEGVPKLDNGTDTLNMPKGKGSIEVINVGQNSSQCRIINTTPGTTISQGDLCVNIVYDRNIKPIFFIYGKFDMDQNGVATDAEAEVVKNLVTRWGGKIADKVSTDVDFVVFGKEPSVPLYTAEEMQQPLIAQRAAEAKAAVDAYNKVRDEAVSYHIPIMNQDRFLYYTGYFESSKK